MIRGEIWWADFGIPFGSEPGFKRPVLIIQEDAINKSAINTVLVVPFTTNLLWADAPGNVYIEKEISGLSQDSVLVVTQITVIDKKRLIKAEKKLSFEKMEALVKGLRLVLNL